MITLYVLAFIIASLLYRRRHRHIDMRTVRRLELDDQYQWALVGSTAPLRLQILSRQPRIRRDTLRHIVGLAERRGYPLDRLRLLRAPQ